MNASVVHEVHGSGAVELIADALPAVRDGDRQPNSPYEHINSRARDLQLQQEAYTQSYDVFIRSCSERQPAAAAMFKKFWVHGMSLADGWQELYVQKQEQLERLTTQHEQLQNEHEVLKANLMGLKATVQNMLVDVSSLLQHTSVPQPAEPATDALQQQHDKRRQKQADQQFHAPPEKDAEAISNSDQLPEPAAESRAEHQLLCDPQPSAAPPAVGSRRSSQIVSSLIGSMEKMSKQFADCQAGRLTPEAESFSRASNTSTSRSNSAAGSRSSSAAGNNGRMPRPTFSNHAGAAAAREAVALPSCVAGGKPLAQQPVVIPQQQGARREPAGQSAVAVPASLADARPSQSHPPSSKKAAPSPATAQRHTLAWFLQNAGSPLSVSSSMPSPVTVHPVAAEAASSAGSRTGPTADTIAVAADNKQKAGSRGAQIDGGGGGGGELPAVAADDAAANHPAATADCMQYDISTAKAASKLPTASKAIPLAECASSQQVCSPEASVSEWVGERSASTSTGQLQSGSSSRVSYRSIPSSSNHGSSRSSSRASLASQLTTPRESSIKGSAAVPEAAVSAPAAAAAPGGRSASRGSSRSSLRSSGASLTAMARSRQRQKQQQEVSGIYQYQSPADGLGSGKATSSMVAAAAAKLGIQLQQQQHLVQQRLGVAGTKGAPATARQGQIASDVVAATIAEGPLTAALNRQSSLSRAPSAGIGRQIRPATTSAAVQSGHSAVPGGWAGAPSHTTETVAAVRQHIARAASAGAAAAGTADGTLRKPASRPSSGGSQKQQRQAAVANSRHPEKRPLQHTTQVRQAPPAAAIHSSPTGGTAAAVQGTSPMAHKQVQQDSPAKSGHSSSSEQSDMVLLGSCASTTGWSNHTSPAFDGTASKRPSPAAAAAGLADVGVSKFLPSHDSSSATNMVKESASSPRTAAAVSDMRASGSAARTLNLSNGPSHTNNVVSSGGPSQHNLCSNRKADKQQEVAVAQQGVQLSAAAAPVKHSRDAATVAAQAAVVPATQPETSKAQLRAQPAAAGSTAAESWHAEPATAAQGHGAEVSHPLGARSVVTSAGQHVEDSDLQDTVNQQDVNQYTNAAVKPMAAGLSHGKVSTLDSLLAAERAISSTMRSSANAARVAAAVAAANSTVVVMSAATAESLGPAELPDAIKLPRRDDSPKKQPQKTLVSLAAATALSSARGSSEGKRSLQYNSSCTVPGAAADARQVPALPSISISRAHWEAQQACEVDQVSQGAFIDLCEPGSPLSPLSKRFRSSCDHLLEQLRQQQVLQDGQHVGQQLPLGCTDAAIQPGIGDPQVTTPGAVSEGLAGTINPGEQTSHLQSGGADAAVTASSIACNSRQQQHKNQRPPEQLHTSSNLTASKAQDGSSTAASGATASDDSIVTVWQATVPDAAAANTHPCVIDLTASSEDPIPDTADRPAGLNSTAADSVSCRSTRLPPDNTAAAGGETEVAARNGACSDRSVPKLASIPVAISMESLATAASFDSCSAVQLPAAARDCVGVGHSRLAVASGPCHAEDLDEQPEFMADGPDTLTAVHDAVFEASATRGHGHADNTAAEQHDRSDSRALTAGSTAVAAAAAGDAALETAMPTAMSEDSTQMKLAVPADSLQHNTSPRHSVVATAAGDSVPGYFSLQELLPIVLDVLAAKAEVDAECDARHLPRLAPTRHLQRYVRQKVPGDHAQYSQALSMLLASLDQHKEQQPEVAVFCRILGGEVDEDYFQHHLALRSHLQLLAAHALLQNPPKQQQQRTSRPQQQPHNGGLKPQHQQQQRQPPSYNVCCSEPTSDAQLSWLLGAWGRQRSSVVDRTSSSPARQSDEHRLHREWWTAVNTHCMQGSGLRLTAGVVDALLLWELEQQVSRLASVADAFKTADAAGRGLLDLQQFEVFCHELNDSMPTSDMRTLFVDELDKRGVCLVSFNEVCRCLLPAM